VAPADTTAKKNTAVKYLLYLLLCSLEGSGVVLEVAHFALDVLLCARPLEVTPLRALLESR
jgi:hypothetical protein